MKNENNDDSRCLIPGMDCDNLETKLRYKSSDKKFDNPSIPSTEDIIQNVLHSPDFPTVAAQILHNSVIRDDKKHLDRYSDDLMPHDMKEHFSRDDSIEHFAREKLRERERDDEKEKDEDEESDDDGGDRYKRKHRRKEKASAGVASAVQRGSPEEMLKYMMEQLPTSPHGMGQLPNSAAEQGGGGMTSFFNPGTGGLENISPPQSPQDVSNQAEGLRDQLNVMSLQNPSSRGMQGFNPGQIQFNMQHNLAPGPIGEPSMIDNAQQMGSSAPSPDAIMKMPPVGFNGGVQSPISDDLQRQMGISNMDTLQLNSPFGAQNPMLNMLSTSKG